MSKLSYTRALNLALAAGMDRDPAVFVIGEDVRHALTNVTAGMFDRFGPERIMEMPLSEQGFTNFATRRNPLSVMSIDSFNSAISRSLLATRSRCIRRASRWYWCRGYFRWHSAINRASRDCTSTSARLCSLLFR